MIREAALVVIALVAREQIVTVPLPSRVSIPGGRYPAGSTREALREAELQCEAEQRGAGALAAEAAPRCRGRSEAEWTAVDVTVSPFFIDRTEVTRAGYDACERAGACRHLPGTPPLPAAAEHPVERASFSDAVAYCRFRGGRLPTEAEWEKAARGPMRRVYPWGAHFVAGRANSGAAAVNVAFESERAEGRPDPSDGFVGSAPIGRFPGGASPHGLLDVAGNVSEWTTGHPGREAVSELGRANPLGAPFGDERVVRGGNYLAPPSELRITRRVFVPPAERRAGVGFRCAYDSEGD